MTVNEATTESEVRTELPGKAELEAAQWALGRIPLKIELRWAAALRAAGSYDVAADLIEGIRTHHGETASWLEEAARLAFSEGRYDQAEGYLRARLDRFPTATAEVALGRFLLETGRLAEADKIAQRLVSAYADHVTVTMLAADVARAQGQRELARNYYLAVVDARGEHPSGLLMMAELALEDGDLDVAREFQRRVLHAYRSGEYPCGATTAQKVARIAESLEDAEAAAEFRARAATEQRASREKTATAIWDALREAGALRRPPEEPGTETTPQTVSTPTPPAKPNGASALERVSGSKKLAVIDTPASGANGRAARPEALKALKELFGHDRFRSGQVDVIERVLDGVDTLAIIPTGGGKSLTYQLPAMLVPGVTLVVSPLIALMKDQVENAPASVRDRVTLINSDIDADERHRRLAGVRDGQIKLLYVAPERLLDPTLRRSLMTAGIARIVIDEAHCISLWGHDFRPDYLTIPLALRDFGNPPVLAVTATATPEMAEQIATALGREMELVRTSVFRENLFYEVVPVADRNERIEKLIELCRKEQGSGIVYVSARKDAESFAETLRHRGVQAAAYHAGMPRELRASAHERFMAGQTRVIVATIAFGMGVDKANVRFIIHMMPPGTVESYAQESGRAGRDGRRARCLLLTAPSDRATLRSRARRDLVPVEALRRTYVAVRRLQRAGWSAVNIDELRWSLNQGVDPDDKDWVDARVALGYLQQAQLIARAPDAPVRFWVRRKAMAGMPFDEFEEEDPLWTALLPKLGEGWQRGETIELDAAETCAALAIEPAQLDALLGDRPDVQLTRDQRSAWYRLLPAPTDAGRVMDRLLNQAEQRAHDRIDQMMTYIDGHECRHRMLAAALGEAISPCGDACDVCDPVHALVPPSPTQKSTRSKRTASAADALVILRTIPDLPYQMGKRGLVWLLGGSAESRLQADRSQAFGALKELGPTRIGRLIDQLVEAGFLEWRIEGEYRLVGMTSRGAGATRKDMEFLPGLSAPVESRTDLVDLAPHDTHLYDRLVNWRSQEASEQRVPPYVIAHNTMLREIARVRPTSADQLLSIGGFGKTRVERYGEAIVRIVAEGTGDSAG